MVCNQKKYTSGICERRVLFRTFVWERKRFSQILTTIFAVNIFCGIQLQKTTHRKDINTFKINSEVSELKT